jgi:hypothetical protein
MTVAALMMETQDSQPFQTEEIQAQKKAVRGGQLGAFYGALEDADLMAQRRGSPIEGRHESETRR